MSVRVSVSSSLCECLSTLFEALYFNMQVKIYHLIYKFEFQGIERCKIVGEINPKSPNFYLYVLLSFNVILDQKYPSFKIKVMSRSNYETIFTCHSQSVQIVTDIK